MKVSEIHSLKVSLENHRIRKIKTNGYGMEEGIEIDLKISKYNFPDEVLSQ